MSIKDHEARQDFIEATLGKPTSENNTASNELDERLKQAQKNAKDNKAKDKSK